MTTNTGKLLKPTPHLDGIVEVITEDMRLIERIFYQIKKIRVET